jgi:hypothetical protein
MTDVIQPAAPAAKWWGNSLTIQGALISAASAALPVLGTIVGINLSGDTVRLLGEQTVAVVQAVGGLAGMLMTVSGRLRATTRLERRSMLVKV